MTPERVIFMPNMTRRSVEAARSGGSAEVKTTSGDRYASPELRAFPRSTLSFQTSLLNKQKGKNSLSKCIQN